MDDSIETGEGAALLREFTGLVDRLLTTGYDSWSRDEVRGFLQGYSKQCNRLKYGKLQVVRELDRRGSAAELTLRGLLGLVKVDLRLSHRDAKKLVVDMERFTPRVSLLGESLSAMFPHAGAALADGGIDTALADVVVDTVEHLPPEVRAERGDEVEETLVEHARTSDPHGLRKLGERIVAHLHPDGPEPDHEFDRLQRSARGIRLEDLADGSTAIRGVLTPECRALLDAVLTPLDDQREPDALGPDIRTPAQRKHDALQNAFTRLLKTGQLPDHAGLPASLIVTVSLADLERRAGRATTHHGGTLTIEQALRLAAEAETFPVILDDASGVMAHGRGRRLAHPHQRKALFARDRGCTFPDCARTAAESEIHHAPEWIHGGRTDIDTMAIACPYHNNEAPRQGWQTVMIDGIPYWTPPKWKDPEQTPVRNYVHHPELLLPKEPDPDARFEPEAELLLEPEPLPGFSPAEAAEPTPRFDLTSDAGPNSEPTTNPPLP